MKIVRIHNLKLVSIVIAALACIFLFYSNAYASSTEVQHTDKADALKELGLFKGTASGYELERAPTRAEGAVMLVRLMGKENEALNKKLNHPFTDVPTWASPYIGYVYVNEITNGVSKSKFGSNEALSASQYATFILRALGYSDKDGDFSWNSALESMNNKSMITESEMKKLQSTKFLRDDTVLLSYNALLSKMKTGKTLLEHLKSQNVITNDQITASLINGPLKLELSKLSEVKVHVNSYADATVYVDTENLSKELQSLKTLKIAKFNSKDEANEFELLLQNNDYIAANEVLNKLSKPPLVSGAQKGTIINRRIQLYPSKLEGSTSYSLYEDPPFDTYIYLVYYNGNDKIVAYSDYYIPFNSADDLLAKVKYPIQLSKLAVFNGLYVVENNIAQDWGNNIIYRAYRLYQPQNKIEEYEQKYGQFLFNIIIKTEQLLDENVLLNYEILNSLDAELVGYQYGTKNQPIVWGATQPSNYQYNIILDYNYNAIGYSVIELPKKVVEVKK